MAVSLSGPLGHAASWFPLGPYGGDARSLAADPTDPKHLFLGTATGWIYDSHDGGSTWTRVAQVANRNDLALDHIVVDKRDPKRLVVGAFAVGHPTDGGLYISDDFGKNWYSQAEMRGQSVRALVRSESNPQELVAGTLKGVFRSRDNGTHWQQISPVGSSEIHEVQSIAIDPADSNVIYAGTWHLPWKTTDGGATWHNVKQGIIDDSDVFSIIVDPKNPKIVYASACSGIYKSSDAGEMFHKVQGIPSAARRTRTLEQDPEHLQTVFAGTTEGLYRTLDAGAQWERLTPADTIVNDVYVDPTDGNHVLLATDRGGVYRSEDGGRTFAPSNNGFSTRQVTAFAADAPHPGTLYVGVVNDKNSGGVFESTDGAVHWQQTSEGLGGRDIFSLISLDDGTLLAGTEHGIYRLDGQPDAGAWKNSSLLEAAKTAHEPAAASSTSMARSTSPFVRASVPNGHAATPARTRARAQPKLAAKRTKVQRGPQRRPVHLVRAKARLKSAKADLRRGPSPHGHVAALQVPSQHAHPRATFPSVHPPEPHAKARSLKAGKVDAEVYSFQRAGKALFAASGAGLLRSADNGLHWTPVSSLTLPDVRFLSVQPALAANPPATIPSSTAPDGSSASVGQADSTNPSPANGTQAAPGTATMLAADLNEAMVSNDAGKTWKPLPLPQGLSQIGALCVDGDNHFWIGGREGVWYSPDAGGTWKTLRNLYLTEVDSIFYDAQGRRVLVTGADSSVVFSVQTAEEKVTYSDTGWKLRFVRPVGDHLVGATLFDGMVVQPQMVDSAIAASVTPR